MHVGSAVPDPVEAIEWAMRELVEPSGEQGDEAAKMGSEEEGEQGRTPHHHEPAAATSLGASRAVCLFGAPKSEAHFFFIT